MEGAAVSVEKVKRIKGIVDEMANAEEAYLLVKMSLEKWHEQMKPVEQTFNECQMLYNLDISSVHEESYQYNQFRTAPGSVTTTGIAIPEGLDGYHMAHRKFIRYLEGCNGLVTGMKVKDSELTLSKCGYWGMDIAESHKFNLEHEENTKLLPRDSKPKLKHTVGHEEAEEVMET